MTSMSVSPALLPPSMVRGLPRRLDQFLLCGLTWIVSAPSPALTVTGIKAWMLSRLMMSSSSSAYTVIDVTDEAANVLTEVASGHVPRTAFPLGPRTRGQGVGGPSGVQA